MTSDVPIIIVIIILILYHDFFIYNSTVLGCMDDDDAQQRMMVGFTDILEREYGRRNVRIDENCIRLSYYPCKISLYVYSWNAIAYAFMNGDADCNNFPVDGSKYDLEMLARQTHFGPGAYVNANGNLFVPNYPFMFRERDLKKDGFVVSVLDRLAEMADYNSYAFNESMKIPEESDSDIDLDDIDLTDLDWDISSGSEGGSEDSSESTNGNEES